MSLNELENGTIKSEKTEGEKIRALVCGHTGATGKALVNALIASPFVETVVAVGRRENMEHPNSSKLTQHIITDMTKIGSADPKIAAGCNAAFCCIGTPFNDVFKKSKQDGYRAVDFGIATGFAEFAWQAGVDFYSTITGEGTEKESNSQVNMYRVKQEVEKYVQTLGFERIAFIRPGFLNRGADAGWTERLMLPGLFGIPVANVAESMIWAAMTQTEAVVGYNGNKKLKQSAALFEKITENKTINQAAVTPKKVLEI